MSVMSQMNDFSMFPDWLSQSQKDCHFFLSNLRGAEFHWFFVQAVDALEHDLYVPAVSSLLIGYVGRSLLRNF